MMPHPIPAPALTALANLATWQPQTPDELARIIATLHDALAPSVIGQLSDALDHLAETLPAIPGLTPGQVHQAAGHLTAAAEQLGPVGAALDRARQATGRWMP